MPKAATALPKEKRPKKERFLSLDLLRGFFIVIIIIDHLSRWPSIFSAISGKGVLWVTAAEGFVIISGLLVGYVRGFKSKNSSMLDVSKTLLSRAFILYLWAVIGSILYTAAIWYIDLVGGAPGMPIEKGDWQTLIIESLALNYTFLWVYFLKLYAVFLAASPIAIWFMRKGLAWTLALISLVLFAVGIETGDKILQWQMIFFISSIAGYYLQDIRIWWKKLSNNTKNALRATLILATFISIVASAISVFSPDFSYTLTSIGAKMFDMDNLTVASSLLAFLWFTGYLMIFSILEKYINKLFGWILIPIGTKSLTSYILHGAVIIIISYLFAVDDGPWALVTCSLLGALAIISVWALIKIPGINKVIPR